MGETLNLNFDVTTVGPVATRFMRDTAPVQGIQGPIGSAKTSCCLMKMFAITMGQRRQPDGVRRAKFCIVRDTYRQLWKTTIPSWHKRVPKTAGVWVGGQDGPASHTIDFVDAHFGKCELMVEFQGIGENSAEDALRGYEVTGFYLNEADLLQEEVFNYARGRAGRYPDVSLGGPTWYGVLLDFNAPDVDGWIYDKLIENRPASWSYHRQPGGRDPGAENLKNLPVGYYTEQVIGQDQNYIDRMIDNKFGFSRAGLPVYPEFNDFLHIANEPLTPVRGLPVHIGADAGRTPSAVFGQEMPTGQWRICRELVATNMGAERFGKEVARVLKTDFAGCPLGGQWADPAAANLTETEDRSWITIVNTAGKLKFRPAPLVGNNLTVRLGAVRHWLTTLLDGGLPSVVLSPNCKVLRRGFNSGYRYRKLQITGENRYSDDPEKNEWSHPHDALQYLAVGGGAYAEIMGRGRDAKPSWTGNRAILSASERT